MQAAVFRFVPQTWAVFARRCQHVLALEGDVNDAETAVDPPTVTDTLKPAGGDS